MDFISNYINLSVALIPGVTVAQNLGPPAYIAIEGSTPIAGGITPVSGAADVALLLAGTQISAQAAADLTAMFSQRRSPQTVYVASYDAGAGGVDDALDALESALIDERRVDADNEAAAAWLSASVWRLWAHPLCAQTASADMITSGKPAGLEDCEIDTVAMHYHGTATESQAAAHAGFLGGFPLIAGPMGLQVYLSGVALPSLTSAQATFAKTNDAIVLQPLGLGASASERIIDQTKAYSGTGWTGVLTVMYAVRRMVAAIQAVKARHAITGSPLFATMAGAAEVTAALNAPLAEMAGVGHFTPGSSGVAPNDLPLPDGYRIVTTYAGDELTATVTLLIGQEAVSLNLNVIGEEQS